MAINAHAPAHIREPAVSDLFYPGRSAVLERTLDQLLGGESATHDALPDGPPRALIVPHAGYVYSGSAAAEAYRHLLPWRDRIHRVVVLGPPHRVPVAGVASASHAFFRTPLGQVKIDRIAIDGLAADGQIEINDEAHREEHAIEVHLPFLQRVIGEFLLVPLLVGGDDGEQVAALLEHWWHDEQTLIVVSTDLSHFLDYESARRRDAATDARIRNLDTAPLGPHDACGCRAVNGLLVLTRREQGHVRRLALCNSGDTAGTKERVVGYASYLVESPAAE